MIQSVSRKVEKLELEAMKTKDYVQAQVYRNLEISRNILKHTCFSKLLLTVSFPNRISTYGNNDDKCSLKVWQMYGALMFIINNFWFSNAVLATSRAEFGLTIRKKPWKKT